MTKQVVPLFAAVVLGACAAADVNGPEAAAGHYTLVDVSGQRVPAILAEGVRDSQCTLAGEVGTRTTRINNGALDLGSDGSFQLGLTIASICEYNTAKTMHDKRYVANGAYSLDDGQLRFTPTRGDLARGTLGFVEARSVTLLADMTGDGLTRSFKFAPEI